MNMYKLILGHLRVFVALAILAAVFAILPNSIPPLRRLIIAWDAGVIGLLLMTLHLFLTHDSKQMPALAEAQEDGQWTIFWVTLLASVVSFFAVTTELSGLKDLSLQQRVFPVVLAASTLIMSWLTAHVVFAIRYAHEWYDCDDGLNLRQGLEFPGDTQPDYMDFLYFSLVLGMTFQVSDVQITSRRLRRLALLHGLVSFLYNTIILALTVNIAAGLL